VWSSTSKWSVPLRVPFVVDVCERTFLLVEQVLAQTWEGLDGSTGWPPSHDKECLAVACLNILHLQLVAMIYHNIPVTSVGLNPGSRLLVHLKQRIVTLSSNAGVLNSIQHAAQNLLEAGWSILLPTADERANTLSSLLSDAYSASPGQQFMTDLLVSSLMADGGLESALREAVLSETSNKPANIHFLSESAQETKRALHNATCSWPEETKTCGAISLLHLVKQLLRNTSSYTLSKVQDVTAFKCEPPEKIKRSPSLNLLIKFQRLLIAQIFPHLNKSQPDQDLFGAESLLKKYINLIHGYVWDVLPAATSCASVSHRHFSVVASILQTDIIGTLLPELIMCLALLETQVPLSILHQVDWFSPLNSLLDPLNKFNRLAPGCDKEDTEDLAWPGIIVPPNSPISKQKAPEDLPLIRKADIENHNRDGGLWIVIAGKVYDVQDFRSQAPCGEDLLRKFSGCDATQAFEAAGHTNAAREKMSNFVVGHYLDPDQEQVHIADAPNMISTTLFDAERTLAYLLGMHARSLTWGSPLQSAEIEVTAWGNAPFLQGGLIALLPANPYEEEKGEARSTASNTPVSGSTPTEPKSFSGCTPGSDLSGSISGAQDNMHGSNRPITTDKTSLLLHGLAEGKYNESLVQAFLRVADRAHRPQQLLTGADHPVEEAGRLLLAVMLRHQGLGNVATALAQQELEGCAPLRLPRLISECIRQMHHTKLALIKTRQQQNRSYKEVCAPVIEKCRFLFYEVRPALSPEVSGLNSLQLLHSESRWKRITKQVLQQKMMLIDPGPKPEDILNASIQSQEAMLMAEVDPIKQMKQDNSDTELEDSITDPLKFDHPASLREDTSDGSKSMLNKTNDWNVEVAKEDQEVTKEEANTKKELEGTRETEGLEIKGQIKKDDTEIIKEGVVDDRKRTSSCKEETRKNVKHEWSSIGDIPQGLHVTNDSSLPRTCGTLMSSIVKFVTQEDGIDVETLRKALYCQIERAKSRLKGLELGLSLLKRHWLLPSVRYMLINAWLGLPIELTCPGESLQHCLVNIELVTPYTKAKVMLQHARISQWAANALRERVLWAEPMGKTSRGLRGKGCLNQGTQGWLGKLPWAR
jgi:E3 ubiquitin-protein ligase HERC2